MDILEAEVDTDALVSLERAYWLNKRANTLNDQMKFEYACALLKFDSKIDCLRCIGILESLILKASVSQKRNYLLYLALAYYRVDDIGKARDAIDEASRLFPESRQINSLKKLIYSKYYEERRLKVYSVSAAFSVAGLILFLLRNYK